MNRILLATGLFGIQTLLILAGGKWFGKFLNPFFLLFTSCAIPLLYIYISSKGYRALPQVNSPRVNKWIWSLAGAGMIMISLPLFTQGLNQFNDPIKISDVIPQVQTLVRRFIGGEYPYTPIDFGTYRLEPVYMPLQWLPAGIAEVLKIDVRWPGFIFLVLASAMHGYFLASRMAPLVSKIISLALPAILFIAFLGWGNADLMVSYEIITGAYYFALATGLLNGKLKLIGLGILLCLLSRYTLLFWLPLMALIYLYEEGFIQSLRFWIPILAGVFVLYIFPFYLKDTTLLDRGHTYYTGATIADWNGYGHPPISWTQENGISFAAVMKNILPGDIPTKVALTRTIQLLILGIILIGLLISYRKLRHHMDMYSFGLLSLYCSLLIFYLFAPLTYRYYLFSFMIISAITCSMIILLQNDVVNLKMEVTDQS